MAVPDDRGRQLIGSDTALAALTALLIVIAYAPAWRLPFVQDDIGLFNWIGGQSLTGLWQASPFGYYRPLTQVVWKLGELLAGRFEPAMLHWVNIAVHTLDALLAGYLAGRWLPQRLSRSGRWLAALSFALYPFTFQVVPFVGALYHPLVTSLILGTLAGYELYRSRSSRAGLIGACACAALAPFAHEAGLIAGPLLGLSELTHAWMQRRRPAWPILIWAAAAPVVGLGIWLAAPKTGPQTARPDASGVLINLTYALQGLTYPLGPIARPIIDATGLSDQVVIWVGGAMCLTAIGLVAWRAGCRRLWAFGVLLWLLGALPFSLTLTPSYTLAAAWLLYEQSIGAVLVWSAGWLGLANLPGRWPRVRRVLAAIGAGAVLLFGAWFVRTRMPYYERLGQAVWDLGEAVQARPADRSVLVVNFPRLARPFERVFPLGVESPQFYGRLSELRDVLAVNHLAVPDAVQTLAFGNLTPSLDYSIELMGRDADWPDLAAAVASVDGVYRSYPGPDRIALRYAGRQLAPESIAPLVRFGRAVALIDAQSRLADDHLLALTLRWQYAGGADNASVFVHVMSGAGELVAQSDGPVMDLLPFWQWPAGRQVEEVRYLALDTQSLVRVQVGVYDPGTGQRLAPVDVNGQAYADGAAPLFEIDPATGTIRSLIAR